jgi:hypothetical protein
VSEQPVWVTVSAHVQDLTPVVVRVHPQDNRVVVIVGDSTGWPRINLYLNRRVLVGFRDTLSAALADLDDAVRALADNNVDTSTTSGTSTSGASSAGSADDVDGPATVRNTAA